MSKRRKSPVKSPPAPVKEPADPDDAPSANPPAKNPTLLAASIVLFALWFVFLLVTALAA